MPCHAHLKGFDAIPDTVASLRLAIQGHNPLPDDRSSAADAKNTGPESMSAFAARPFGDSRIPGMPRR